MNFFYQDSEEQWTKTSKNEKIGKNMKTNLVRFDLNSSFRMIQKAKKHGLATTTEIKETIGAGFNKKKPPTDKEIEGVLKGTITKPTGIFAAKGGKV